MLINRKAVKAFALARAQATGRTRFTRVSSEFVQRSEAMLRRWLQEEVHRQPSVGKTLK